jgi:hypothetical protein
MKIVTGLINIVFTIKGKELLKARIPVSESVNCLYNFILDSRRERMVY